MCPACHVAYHVIFCFSTCRLQRWVQDDTNGHVIIEDLYHDYITSCTDATPCTKVMLGTIVRKFYPSIAISTVKDRVTKKTNSVYKGLSRRTDNLERQILNLEYAMYYLPDNAMVTTRVDGHLIFSIPSNVVCNGNIVLKKIHVNLDHNEWSLRVRDKDINLQHMGVSNAFDGTIPGLHDSIDVVSKITICRGVPLGSGNKVIPASSSKEFVYDVGEENTSTAHVRVAACSQVINWSNKTLVCTPCQKAKSRLDLVNN